MPLGLVRYVDGPGRRLEQPKRIGVLYLDGQDRGTLLSPTTRAALETLAGEAALVIENARLYREAIENARLEQQMKIAADIQRALLPNPHYSGNGFELACASVPCLAIGGDFFDYVDLPDGGFGFVLGDVSGKGLPAALLTAVVQGVFAIEASLGHSPSAALAALNETMIRKAVEGRFATIFYGALSQRGKTDIHQRRPQPADRPRPVRPAPPVVGRDDCRRLSGCQVRAGDGHARPRRSGRRVLGRSARSVQRGGGRVRRAIG